ncbi:MAG TPA: hypothetical protein VK203_15420 [Nostocaceae cyanobacterium]|nr:hypothetical protein [Nostocaceae cyanobacterium]
MNEILKTLKITLGAFMLLSLFTLGWNLYQKKQAETYCEDLKQLRSQTEKLQVPAPFIEVEEGLRNCQ